MKTRKRLEWLDCLRGIAVLFVIVQHTASGLLAVYLPLVYRYFNLGLFGVVVFFCVSGYVIPYSIFSLRNNAALRFPIGRIFRLYPAYWLSLAVAGWLIHPGLRLELVNATMFQRFMGQADVLGVYWTLQVEITFYLIFQGIILLRQAENARIYPVLSMLFAGASVAMAAARYILNIKTPLAPTLGLTVMFLATSYFMYSTRRAYSRKKMVALTLSIFALLLCAFYLGYSKDWGYHEMPVPFCISYVLGAGAFLFFEKIGIRSRILGFLGKVSYPLYLFHVPVGLVFSWLGLRLWPNLCGELFGSLVVATLVHYMVELPFVRLGKTTMKRLPGMRQASS